MSDSSNLLSKETIDQDLLKGIQKATNEGNAKDAKELMAAYAMSKRLDLTAEKQSDEYAIKCTELEANDEQTKVQREQIEAQKEADKQKAVAQKVSAGLTAGFAFLGTVVGAVITGLIASKTSVAIEDKKIGYGLEFQKRHFDAQKEDDLVTKYGDESFRPR